jgi:hypothetical protein
MNATATVSSTPTPTPTPSPTAIAPGPPDVELRPDDAVVAGTPIPFDGVAEGLAWPALKKALAAKTAPVVLAVPRDLPVDKVLRAVWNLRDGTVRLQTPDADGAPHVLELRPASAPAPAATPACHLAVFVQADGALRVAAPGGPRAIPGPNAGDALARALEDESKRCALRYVAFGAEDPRAAWGGVFDVAWAVDRAKAAGDARYVLGEPVHVGR